MVDGAEKQAIGVLEGLDETGNAMLGPVKEIPEAGNPHYTMSQRWAYERQAGPKKIGYRMWARACIICKLLTWCFKRFYPNEAHYDHCTDAIKNFPANLPSEG
jgi:hypothetical protein